jgi:hypothetical protein
LRVAVLIADKQHVVAAEGHKADALVLARTGCLQVFHDVKEGGWEVFFVFAPYTDAVSVACELGVVLEGEGYEFHGAAAEEVGLQEGYHAGWGSGRPWSARYGI